MFDILVYLFENYFQTDACPDAAQLALKLSAAGFDDEEISEALDWLDGLRETDAAGPPAIAAGPNSTRCYSDHEISRLDAECRGFLVFLGESGVLTPLTRERIIERAMALSDHAVSLSKLKIIVLMVLWNQHQTMDTLILEELLSDDNARFAH